jgi:hypothetical protein
MRFATMGARHSLVSADRKEHLMIRTASPRLSYSTDPIAAGVQRALATTTFVAADRSAEAQTAFTGGRLDVGYLYPALAQPAVHTGVSSRIASIAASFASIVSGRSAAPAARR